MFFDKKSVTPLEKNSDLEYNVKWVKFEVLFKHPK